jgi:hypothetical protein
LTSCNNSVSYPLTSFSEIISPPHSFPVSCTSAGSVASNVKSTPGIKSDPQSGHRTDVTPSHVKYCAFMLPQIPHFIVTPPSHRRGQRM